MVLQSFLNMHYLYPHIQSSLLSLTPEPFGSYSVGSLQCQLQIQLSWASNSVPTYTYASQIFLLFSLPFSLFLQVYGFLKVILVKVGMREKSHAYVQSTIFNHKSLFHLYQDGFHVIMIQRENIATFVYLYGLVNLNGSKKKKSFLLR